MTRIESVFLAVISLSAFGADKMAFWKTVPRGANMSSKNPETDFAAAAAYGIQLVRFGATGSPGDFRFLVSGEAPNEEWNLSEESITRLRSLVAMASRQKLKVVISLAHVPGRVWEHRKRDYRIWHEKKYQREFVEAWKAIATTLKGENTVVGYDLLNEPYLPTTDGDWSLELWGLYKKAVAAICSIDVDTPIILESPDMASPDTLQGMPVFSDKLTIYSFHY